MKFLGMTPTTARQMRDWYEAKHGPLPRVYPDEAQSYNDAHASALCLIGIQDLLKVRAEWRKRRGHVPPGRLAMDEWHDWFAWRPVKLLNGRRVWLRTVQRRYWCEPLLPGRREWEYRSHPSRWVPSRRRPF